MIVRKQCRYFYPRSPCGERQYLPRGQRPSWRISIHALLAESDLLEQSSSYNAYLISIHALLAESDKTSMAGRITSNDFYPRSPCGERRNAHPETRLPCAISIHALLAESDTAPRTGLTCGGDFYPRSPCGERPTYFDTSSMDDLISIHALLAESDH